jgi:hypothetical protein
LTPARARWLFGAASLLLAATAVFHATGHDMAASMVAAERQSIMRMIWLNATIGWLVVAAIWLAAAVRISRDRAGMAAIAALFPLASGVSLGVAVGPGHPGIWMLLASAVLALSASWSNR